MAKFAVEKNSVMDDIYSLGMLVHCTSTALIKSFNAAMKEDGIDLPHSQYVVLRLLYYKDGLSQQDLSHMLSKDSAAIKRTIDNLVKKGLVERVSVRAMKNSIVITENGRELMPRLFEITTSVIDKAFGKMPESKRDKLRGLLNEVLKNI